MKKLFIAFSFVLCLGFASAQQATPITTTSKNLTTTPKEIAKPASPANITKPAAKKVDTKAKTKSAVKMKKDGTPDKRYKANKRLKKDGTPDKRYK